MLIRVAVCASIGAARVIELFYSQRNIQKAGSSAQGTWSRRTFPLVFMLHAGVLLGTLFRGHGLRLPALALLLAIQPIRAWVLLTLGDRWNVRGAVPASMKVATEGPYAFVRHPNYTVVAIELASLPAAFRLDRLAIAASAVNALLLAVRIKEEEAALFQLPGYREHFDEKPRFLPSLF